MKYDEEKIDEAALALLFVNSWTEKSLYEEGLCDSQVAWKSLDWDIGERLHEKGLITNPVGKAKSIGLTEEGVELAKKIAVELFEKESS